MQIVFHKSFKKDIKKLPVKIQEQFTKRVDLFKEEQFNPILNNHNLHHPYLGCRSINISGDIRAIYSQQNNLVTFLYIGSHSDLYE